MSGMVRYVGTADVRVITEQEWRAAGITDMGTVTWSENNRWTVSVREFSDDALAMVISPDPGFVITGQEPRDPNSMTKAELLEELGGDSGMSDKNVKQELVDAVERARSSAPVAAPGGGGAMGAPSGVPNVSTGTTGGSPGGSTAKRGGADGMAGGSTRTTGT